MLAHANNKDITTWDQSFGLRVRQPPWNAMMSDSASLRLIDACDVVGSFNSGGLGLRSGFIDK